MKKINAIITLLLLGGILFGLAVADICTPDRLFSEYETEFFLPSRSSVWKSYLTEAIRRIMKPM